MFASRHDGCAEVLAWFLLVIGCLASSGTNVAMADPTVIAPSTTAWPSFTLIGTYEMLMCQIRRSVVTAAPSEAPAGMVIRG
ncbi:hypothetical protein DMB42_01890 [Nonomuraea sp. WAC 01424]|nr:hypothetical protein DMB42_01890 [Nonomuraea sp. WAC 01424]